MSWQYEQSTLKQRMALEGMYARLGWPTKGIRDYTKQDAADAFVRCRKALRERDERMDYREPFDPDSQAAFSTTEY